VGWRPGRCWILEEHTIGGAISGEKAVKKRVLEGFGGSDPEIVVAALGKTLAF
jgi:hypothetical protein